MDERKTKECKSCYQQIDVRAKKCPYCHYWQRKFSVFIHHPLSSIIYIALFIAGWYVSMHLLTMGISDSFDYIDKSFSQDSGLVIESHHQWFPTEDSLSVVGVIANTGSSAWDSIDIEVELFDKEGKFVYECSEYISGILYSGEKENFVVGCSGCYKAPIPEFDYYEIKVVDAYYESVDEE